MRRLAQIYERLIALLGVLAALLVALMTAGMCADVLMRNLGLGVIPGVLELTEYALFLITFFGAPWVLRQNGHIAVDVLVTSMPPPIARLLDAVANIAGMAVAGVLGWYAISVAADSHATGARVIKELIFPEWWIFAAVAFAAALLLIEFARRLVIGLRGPASVARTAAADKGI